MLERLEPMSKGSVLAVTISVVVVAISEWVSAAAAKDDKSDEVTVAVVSSGTGLGSWKMSFFPTRLAFIIFMSNLRSEKPTALWRDTNSELFYLSYDMLIEPGVSFFNV